MESCASLRPSSSPVTVNRLLGFRKQPSVRNRLCSPGVASRPNGEKQQMKRRRYQYGCLTKKNNTHSDDVWLSLPKTPSELKPQRFRAFVRSLCDHDELTFRRSFRFCRLQFSKPCRPAGGDPRASSPNRGYPKERATALTPPRLRPVLVGLALAMVTRLAP